MISKSSRIAYIIMAAGFLLRLGFVQFINPIDRMIFSDMANYVQISNKLLKNEWLVTHFFQPIGFPYLLFLLRSMTPDWFHILAGIQIVTSTVSLWFIWKTTKETMGEKIGLISLFVASVHLPWIAFNGLILSESLFIFFLSALAWLTLRLVREGNVLNAILWVVIFFVGFLIKGTHVFLAPLLILTIYYFKRTDAIKYLATMVVLLSMCLVGHGLLTKAKINKFQMSASAGGLNFVEGKCPQKNNADSNSYSWLSPLYHQLGMTDMKRWDHPFSDSGFFMKEGFKCIGRNPLVLVQAFEGIPYLFVGNTLWPVNQMIVKNTMRLYELFFGCFSLIGLAVYFRFLRSNENKTEEILIWVLPILSVFLCVYIFKSEIRFRIPFDVWIIPVTVKGWSYLFKARIA
jgi:hypothetical protein